MLLETPNSTGDFLLLDTGDGHRLEQWGKFIVVRPDPQIIWQKTLPEAEWQKSDARFLPGKGEEKGRWELGKKLPGHWDINIGGLDMRLKLTPFKHTGVFPEQAAQWEWMKQQAGGKKLKILNLFAYTGGATMALAQAGNFVTHVDASKPALAWAKENQALNKLSGDSVRWILDDAIKFVKREIKRGQQYDAVVMDPPAFGHSPTGATWKFNRDLPQLLGDCVQLLSSKAKFLVINGYATNSSAIALNNILEDSLKNKNAKIEFGELCLKQKSGRIISTGIFTRASF